MKRKWFKRAGIVLAAALLTAILMFVQGQRTETARELSHAQQVGYYNISSFTRRFKLHTGLTPGEYRRHAAKT